MTVLYTTNFDGGTAGTLPSGWTSVSGGWAARTAGAVSGTLALAPSETSDSRVVIATGAQTADGTLLYKTRYQAGAIPSPIFRADATFSNGYVIALNANNGDALLFTRTNGNFSQVGGKGSTLPSGLSAGDILNIEVSFVGTTIEYRVWKDSVSRPSTASASFTNSAFTAAGYTGVYQANLSAVTANGFDDYTVSDTNTGGGGTTPPATKAIAPNDAAIVYSPGNWTGADATSNASINAGAYSRVMFSGSTCVLNFNVSAAQAPLTQIAYRVDGGAWTVAPLASTITVAIPSDTASAAYHLLEWLVKSTSETLARWIRASATAVVFTGLTIADSAIVRRPRVLNNAILIFGDSIAEAVRTLNETAANDTDRNDSRTGWALEVGRLLGVEVGVIGFGRQGWTIGGNGGVPTLPSSVGFVKQGVARTFPSNVVAVIVNMGTNDGGASDADVTSAVTSFLTTVLTATTASIVLLRPFNGAKASAILSAKNADTSGRVYYVDTDGVLDTSYGIDSVGLHPNGPNNLGRIAPALADKLRQYAQPRHFTVTEA